MLNLRSLFVVAALSFAAPASAETTVDLGPAAMAELATRFADAMSSESNDIEFHRVIEFAPASARVYSADREKLQRMTKTWALSGQRMITVHGYSDSLDLRLAQRRAEKIRGYLIRFGISPSRVAAIGHTLDNDGRRVDLSIGRCSRGQCAPANALR